ncbi:MAG: T9SS type A sorting domain-containing protein [Nonlabens sp.]
MSIRIDDDCRDCSLSLNVEYVEMDELPLEQYRIYGAITNTSSNNLIVQLSLTNAAGFLNPSSINIPAGAAVNLNPLTLIPQGTLSRRDIRIKVEAETSEGTCITYEEVEIPNGRSGKMEGRASLRVLPNPVLDSAQLKYDFPVVEDFKASYTLYDLNGVRLDGGIVHKAVGTVSLHTAQLPAGHYLVVMEDVGGNRAGTHLVKDRNMKRALFILLLAATGLAPAQEYIWAKRGGGNANFLVRTPSNFEESEHLRDIRIDSRGNRYYLAIMGGDAADLDGAPIDIFERQRRGEDILLFSTDCGGELPLEQDHRQRGTIHRTVHLAGCPGQHLPERLCGTPLLQRKPLRALRQRCGGHYHPRA